MGRFFNIDNPVWRFIGNIADMFLLSLLWYLCCLPVFTMGAGSTAMYYVTLKLTRNQEGYTWRDFRHAFRSNFKPATLIWLLFLAVALILGADIYWSLFSGGSMSMMFLPAFGVLILLYLLNLFFIFPLLARCDNTVKALLKMNFALSLRNFLPLLSAIIMTAAIFLVGLFVFWPLLLIAPGLSAYLNSYLYNRILEKYGLNLPNMTD
ncbi:MAG: YesL family protein [Lachnospiraceae bacterium]|nr:YesL family protein [Lachnospiraceae bacterium]